jgi:plastocyanin
MSGVTSRRLWRLAGAALLTTALLPIVAASRGVEAPPPREIRMVVRDMTFYIEGQNEPNPTLRVGPGEQIRLALRNEDPGMSHDFAVGSWQVMTPLLSGRGAEAVVVFRVPLRRGTYTYNCTPHAELMRGSLQVE